MSVEPPGGKGTISLSGRAGYCACAAQARRTSAIAPHARAPRAVLVRDLVLSLRSGCTLLIGKTLPSMCWHACCIASSKDIDAEPPQPISVSGDRRPGVPRLGGQEPCGDR